MGKITKIEPQKNNPNRVSIYIDGKFGFGLYNKSLLDMQLEVGQIVNQEQLEKIVQEDNLKKAINKGLYYLSFKSRTVHEMHQKLKDCEFEEAIIEKAIKAIKALNYLDDYRYAEDYIHSRMKKKGAYKIKQELMRKGIQPSDVDMIFENLDKDEIYQYAYDLVVKKDRQIKDEEIPAKRKDKLMRFLAGKGYQYDLIKSVVNTYLENKSFEEEENESSVY